MCQRQNGAMPNIQVKDVPAVPSVLRRLVAAGTCPNRGALFAVEDLASLPLQRAPHAVAGAVLGAARQRRSP
jgi:hypothetical protein